MITAARGARHATAPAVTIGELEPPRPQLMQPEAVGLVTTLMVPGTVLTAWCNCAGYVSTGGDGAGGEA